MTTPASALHETDSQLPIRNVASNDRSSSLSTVGIKRTNSATRNDPCMPTTTSQVGNQQLPVSSQNNSFKKQKLTLDHFQTIEEDKCPMTSLFTKLTEHSATLEKQKQARISTDIGNHKMFKDGDASSSGSNSKTPVTDPFAGSSNGSDNGTTRVSDDSDVAFLKRQLEAAHSKIAVMDQELSQSRIARQTFDHVINGMPEFEPSHQSDVSEQTIRRLQHTLNESTRPSYGRMDNWQVPEDARSDIGDAAANGVAYNRNHALWGAQRSTFSGAMPPQMDQQATMSAMNHGWNPNAARQWVNGNVNPTPHVAPQPFAPMPRRAVAGQLNPDQFRSAPQLMSGASQMSMTQNMHNASIPLNRPGSAIDPRFNTWGSFAPSMTPMDAMAMTSAPAAMPLAQMGVYPAHNGYHPRPVGTRLSPTAAEFSAEQVAPTPWNAQVSPPPQPVGGMPAAVTHPSVRVQPPSENGSTFVVPTEPMNYRRLLERTMNCNWNYIVEKIVCNNDQQASIFLQQKVKVGTAEQKFDIVNAIIAQCFPLMTNRFGNFLVQRCFEHGTPEQIVAIANAIRGNVLTLSMDAFGCHVIQKAFDAVPEDYKAIMVHELLRRIPETVVHRYACHVWQKLFELRWSDSPPQIMKYVNEALQGMWHEVALGETGSLVVQNIFENCLEEDKRPCITEVLASIDVISHGQFGNWCIQHICEHGAHADRTRAIEHILRFATEYSTDQYASKVVEKCLKIGGTEFLDHYLSRVCEGRSDRPRMPLIDIAGDQFGNYLIQWILMNANPQHREAVATHVRKHMVSLRGSKYGSRVAMLCCNPAYATRPGPPVGMQVNRYNQNGNNARGIYGGAYR